MPRFPSRHAERSGPNQRISFALPEDRGVRRGEILEQIRHRDARLNDDRLAACLDGYVGVLFP